MMDSDVAAEISKAIEKKSRMEEQKEVKPKSRDPLVSVGEIGVNPFKIDQDVNNPILEEIKVPIPEQKTTTDK